MISYIVMVGLITGAGYWTIRPLLQDEGYGQDYAPEPEDALEALADKKEGAYATIQDLEFDLNMGKLSEEDFQVLKKQYMEEAVGYMKEMDRLTALEAKDPDISGADLEEGIEREVSALRSSRQSQGKRNFCSSCGAKVAAADRFCGGCGELLQDSPADPESPGERAGGRA